MSNFTKVVIISVFFIVAVMLNFIVFRSLQAAHHDVLGLFAVIGISIVNAKVCADVLFA